MCPALRSQRRDQTEGQKWQHRAGEKQNSRMNNDRALTHVRKSSPHVYDLKSVSFDPAWLCPGPSQTDNTGSRTVGLNLQPPGLETHAPPSDCERFHFINLYITLPCYMRSAFTQDLMLSWLVFTRQNHVNQPSLIEMIFILISQLQCAGKVRLCSYRLSFY